MIYDTTKAVWRDNRVGGGLLHSLSPTLFIAFICAVVPLMMLVTCAHQRKELSEVIPRKRRVRTFLMTEMSSEMLRGRRLLPQTHFPKAASNSKILNGASISEDFRSGNTESGARYKHRRENKKVIHTLCATEVERGGEGKRVGTKIMRGSHQPTRRHRNERTHEHTQTYKHRPL